MELGLVQLLFDRRFWPIFLTQFFAAFNDNAFKLAMLTLISYDLSNTQVQSEYYQALAGALFILPFFFLSATSGQIVDKRDKAVLTRWVKLFELLLMVVGSFALYFGSIGLMMLVLTGLGIHSTFFGPIKFAILPDLLPEHALLNANALVQSSTFIAILLGTTLGALAVGANHTIPYTAIMMIVSAAVIGLLASLLIPSAPSKIKHLDVDGNIFRATYTLLRDINNYPAILQAVLIISWFWLVGTVMLTKLPDYTHYILLADNTVFALFLALFSIGIALGSLIVTRIIKLSASNRIVPLAMIGFSIFTLDLYWATPRTVLEQPLMNILGFLGDIMHWRIAADLFLLSFCSGLFVVPLYTYLQIAGPQQKRARVIAVNNIYNSLFMVLGSVLVVVLVRLEVSIPKVFLVLAVMNLFVAGYLWFRLRVWY